MSIPLSLTKATGTVEKAHQKPQYNNYANSLSRLLESEGYNMHQVPISAALRTTEVELANTIGKLRLNADLRLRRMLMELVEKQTEQLCLFLGMREPF